MNGRRLSSRESFGARPLETRKHDDDWNAHGNEQGRYDRQEIREKTTRDRNAAAVYPFVPPACADR